MRSIFLVITLFLGFSCNPVFAACKKPVPPEMPSDAADVQELDRAARGVNLYMKEMKKYRECQMKIINDADNELAAVIEGWNRAVELLKQNDQE